LSYFLARKTLKPITETNKKLKEYNHNLAHELKTPLSVIKSDLELLEL
jgi:signal transduction histidine kinase